MASSARFISTASKRSGLLISRWSSASRGANSFNTPIFGGIAQRWLSSYPAHEVVGMPSLSPTMEAGTIAQWNMEEGEAFAAGDVLCEIETDKATVSFEAQDDGVIAKILEEAGSKEIDCGVPILITVEEEDDVAAFKDYVVEASSIPSESQAEPATPAAAPTPEPAPVAPPTPAPVAAAPAPVAATGGHVVASPLAWTIAKEKGLDLSSIAIAGTGPDGRIIADDVREYVPMAVSAEPAQAAAAAAPAATTAAAPIVGDNYTDYPLNEASIATANLLAHSKQTIPHYYLTVDVTLDALINLRATLNSTLDEDSQLSLNDLLIKASACAMKACPSANASWMGDSVRMYDNVDINVVMGNGDNLYAPLVKDVGSRGVKSISDELSSNLDSIEEGTIAGENFSAVGTVTVMNLGMYGVKSCAPIIRAPQAVALALGAAENRVVPKEDGEGDDIYETKVLLTATLSCDHRVVDGAVGAQFLSAFKAAVEKPETLLL
jgi:pyruvate dehydrogenase E2 component (dihydrolipoamide acetyltransferase)